MSAVKTLYAQHLQQAALPDEIKAISFSEQQARRVALSARLCVESSNPRLFGDTVLNE